MRLPALSLIMAWMLAAGMLLAGCNVINPTPSPALPTIVLDANRQSSPQVEAGGGEIVASGVVVPGQDAVLVFALGGKVQSVEAAVGDSVQAGQVLVRLAGGEKLAAVVEAAKLELLSAQQALEALNKDLDVRRARGLKNIADNRDRVRDAERALSNLRAQSRQVDIDAASAQMILAKEKLDKAQEDYEPYANKPEENLVRAALLSRLAEARRAYEAAVRLYNNLLGSANEIDVSQAEADLAISQADLAKAQRDYEILLAGADPAEVALAEARLSAAQASLQAAEISLEDLELRAPFNGTITHLDTQAGEWVTPGQPVLMLSDLVNMRVETTDLSELDVPDIRVGGQVSVVIEALGETVNGQVRSIAPLADVLGGDVVYKVSIDLAQRSPKLRAGMSVEVRFMGGEP